jgi:hypothetical protein
MNDTELDDMLNQWESPKVPARLRESIKLPPPQRKWRLSWPSWHLSKGLLAGALAGLAMCFIGITAAFPQVLTPTPRFNLLSEYLEYNDDGSSRIQEYRASTAQNGQETIIERTNPDNWMMNLHFHLFDTLHRLLGINEQPPRPMALSDCSMQGMSVIGHEAILNYRTTVQRAVDENGGHYTEWRAPDLGCIVMKATWEKLANGELKLTDERRPLGVRINHAQ